MNNIVLEVYWVTGLGIIVVYWLVIGLGVMGYWLVIVVYWLVITGRSVAAWLRGDAQSPRGSGDAQSPRGSGPLSTKDLDPTERGIRT